MSVIPSAPVRADWLQHASLAFASGIGIGVLTREPGAAAGGAITLGIGKELIDARRDRFDTGDLIADVLGASLAALVIAALER